MTIDAATFVPAPSPLRRKAVAGALNSAAGHLVMVLLSIICIFPVYWMIATSLRAPNALFEVSLWPTAVSLDNYIYALNAIPIGRMLFNTLLTSTAVTLIQLFTGLLAAYAFARWRFPFDKLVHTAVALTWLVPFQVVMIPNYLLVVQMGLLDSLMALILPHFASALAILLLAQAMRSFPSEVIESARMDGARSWRILWEIIMPNLRGTVASLAILIFISTWNEYFWPLLLSRTAENSVIQIGIQMFMTAEGNEWGPLMAASTLASLPILILYIVLQRQVVQSFMKSGIR
ncbi:MULTISPECIES: carbohydrate ABC transporter permease [unclassified Agrobacterium]|uniref:carbohydrate ABC transporter permease n=1 Tax=unclassified Agrobacterium TaxID=2632611 RepID=UPI00244D59D4|nr:MULTISPECIES: carbohydrate ABC transporter permease [unclassified Agrobacterium]MDH0613670.1 carbohydrate ABC transporter permease [Agrobacterium sp. GD03872]MDH0696559.1 carbohydrate ABC transporter permease [Agrobacterium sp. GD03871]MDH1059871.1 carbohydrate ABC transporter permease [Agrobacterium sp. GD03992]MDH2210192.1 carbohydrate ABC transporter permease [Agrobacterium sp. GD03643]MDH2219691.1 carbohydrate ABC transporter permease [Agrobacterium sp. GD03638]